MNPDKLFDYLDGKLSAEQREKLEDQLIKDPELQRQFGMARKIHERMSGNVREVILDEPPPGADRGRQIVKRITIVFVALVFLNTVIGLIAIGMIHSKRQRERTAADQNRQDLTLAAQRAAATALPTPTLVDEIKIAAPAKEQDAIVEKITAAATQTGGSAAKNLTNENGTLVFAEIPVDRLGEFNDRLAKLGAIVPVSAGPSPGNGNAILQIRITSKAE